MDAIYYISGTLMAFTLIGLIAAAVYFLLKPHHLQKSKHINKPVSRGAIVLVTLVSLCLTLFTFGTVMAATEPASVKQARAAEEAAKLKAQQNEERKAKEEAEAQRKREEEAKKPVVKNITKVSSVPFKTLEQNDAALPQGQKQVAVDGVNGVRKITYAVTYVQGKEVSRKLLKNVVTVEPIDKIVKVGTYVEPAPQAEPSGGGSDGYINSRGNYVPSPSSDPAGATAKCADGTYSYSQSRRGTCSHHGGVAVWL